MNTSNIMNESYDEPMEDVPLPAMNEAIGENGDFKGKGKNRFQFKKFDEFGVKIKQKKNPNKKHTNVKRFVAPKNALMCLMEAHSGINFVEEGVQVDPKGNVFSISVEVNGIKYCGRGLSKDLAKHAAAEEALAGFVKNPGASDLTPWSSIASFAMYKLFNEWNCNTKTTNAAPTVSQTEGTEANATEVQGDARKPAKQLPESAISMNPVMLLHQMRPEVAYQATQNPNEQGQVVFTMTSQLDGQSFVGLGSNMKKAKFELAKEAVRVLFNVESTWVPA